MNLSVLHLLFFGFSVFLISVLIWLKRGDDIAKRWLYFSVAVTGYSVGYAFVFSNSISYHNALVAARLGNASAALIPVTWLYFICGFLEIEKRRLFCFLWPMSVILSVLGLTAWAIPSVSPAKGFSYQPEAGPLLHFQTVNYLLVVTYSFYLMIRSLAHEQSKERKREIASLVFATIFGFIGGFGEFTLIYFRDKGLDLSFLLITYPFLMAYVMIKHGVLDPEKIAGAIHRDKLATIGLLSASINHEIRSPLFVIQGQTELLLERLKNRTPSTFSEADRERFEIALKKTQEQTMRIIEIAKRLTDFSKPTADKGIKEEVNLQSVMDSILSFVGYGLKIDNISIEKVIDVNLTFQCNQKELEQILLNLVMNAAQAMKEERGEIRIEASEKKGKAEIKISDTGPGIPQDKLKAIFEPFFTTKQSGTGLGLYITKQLVERNKGKISVESKVGVGTMFILEFLKPR